MIYVCEYDGSVRAELLQSYAPFLPVELPQDWTQGKKWEKSRQRILAWLLLEYALKEDGSDMILPQLQIIRDEHGKPYSSICPELHFNISHCDTACACILSGEAAGVDVERKFPYREVLERNICHERELELLRKMGDFERERQLQCLWSMKESYVKRNGRGLGYGVKRIDLSELLPVRDGNTGYSVSTSEESMEDCFFYVKTHARYTLTACSRLPEEVFVVSEEALLNRINTEKQDFY